VNQSERLIADTLRDIAAEAPAPRPMADTAWQAGRRRRWGGLAAAGTAGAGAIATAIALPLAVAGSPSQPPSVLTGPTLPVSLPSPVQFRQVASISGHVCPPGSSGVPGPASQAAGPEARCFHLTGTGMTVSTVRAAWVTPAGTGQYVLNVRFRPADASRFAALTRKLVDQPTPRCQLAIIIGGRVIAAPVVEAPITAGQAQIPGFATRAQADRLLHQG
jgi:SecDF, P1 head subdomain